MTGRTRTMPEEIEPLTAELVPTPTTDRLTVRLVVGFIGAMALLGVAFGGLLALNEKAVPDFLVATTSGALGALGALLAKTSTS